MLNNKRLTIVADTVIDDVRIARFGAVIDLDSFELSMSSSHLDKDACKDNKETVRADQAEFEDYAYELQDMLRAVREAEA